MLTQGFGMREQIFTFGAGVWSLVSVGCLVTVHVAGLGEKNCHKIHSRNPVLQYGSGGVIFGLMTGKMIFHRSYN